MNAIDKLQAMFKQNTDPSFWGHNIMEASKLCRTENDFKHFYAFMTNPLMYNKEAVEHSKTMKDLSAEDLVGCIKPLPEGMVPHVFENGNETIIYTKNEMKEEDDEKTL
jgi:hypothetical protein